MPDSLARPVDGASIVTFDPRAAQCRKRRNTGNGYRTVSLHILRLDL